MSSTLSLSTLRGVMLRGSAANWSHTRCADATDTCWPTMERASVLNASPRGYGATSPTWGIRRRITRSRLVRCLQASAQ